MKQILSVIASETVIEVGDSLNNLQNKVKSRKSWEMYKKYNEGLIHEDFIIQLKHHKKKQIKPKKE